MTSASRAVAHYRGESLRVRAHVRLRWLSCPLDAVLAEVPMRSRVLDYGCGHGLMALAAAHAREADVFGVDIDDDKIAVAKRVAAPRTRFASIDPGEIPAGAWQVVTVVDVLYLLGREQQVELLARLRERLESGGVLIVKETDDRPRAKVALLRAQEHLMVRVLRATKGVEVALTNPRQLAVAMRDAGLAVEQRPLPRYPYPHYLLVGRAP